MTKEQFKKLMVLMDYDDGVLVAINDCLLINCNDFFAPAADAEEVSFEELPELLDAVNSHETAMQWVAKKRGIECKHWREKYKKG
jgi:hypothetical protein